MLKVMHLALVLSFEVMFANCVVLELWELYVNVIFSYTWLSVHLKDFNSLK